MKRYKTGYFGLKVITICIMFGLFGIKTDAASTQLTDKTHNPVSYKNQVKIITEEIGVQSFKPETITDDSSETLFEGYIESRDKKGNVPKIRKFAGNRLSGMEQGLYNQLTSYISQVAAGDRASTKFEIPLEDLGVQMSWTATELGVEAIVADGAIAADVEAAVIEKYKYSPDNIIQALLVDHPYELYWYDKVQYTNTSSNYGFSASNNNDIDEYILTVTGNITFSFPVADEYSAGDYTFNTEIGQSVQTIIENASTIVSRYSTSSDYNKLVGYRNEICNLVSYNHEAADGDVSYGNPWQLIWVFDGNPDTNVVCEGYSKAFQYLFNLTDFKNDIDCVTVTGTMDGGSGAGGHMWNIVTMEDKKNYLVDVTNCDEGTVGADDLLFLAGYTSKDSDTQYTFNCDGNVIVYIYDSMSLNLYSEELELSDHTYVDHKHTYSDWTVTKEATCTETGSREKVCSVCGDTITETISMTEHPWNEDYTVDKTPTCAEEGSESIRCSVCKVIKEGSSRPIEKTAHTWDEGKVTREPVGDIPGVKTYTCTACGETKTEEFTINVDSVIEQINALSDISTEEEISAARAAYNLLPDNQKDQVPVDVLNKLADQEERIRQEKAKADLEEANEVSDKIAAISSAISVQDEQAIVGARAAYNSLTAAQKELVSNETKAKLENAERVITVVKSISTMNVNDPRSVAAARQAYNSLSENQKKMVNPTAVNRLSKAEEAITARDKAKANQNISVTSVIINGISHNIAAGKRIQLTATVGPNNATNKKLTWTSSNTKVATVNQNGLVTIYKKTGGKSVIITAKAVDGSGKSNVWKITSMKGVVKSVSIKGAKAVKAGKPLKLKATVKASKKANTKLMWTSSNPDWANVTKSGKVVTKTTGKGKTVKITAMATDGSGKKKTVKIKIK